MRMQLIIDEARVYGKNLRKGDEFDVPEKEAKLWSALARAKPAGYVTADVKTEQSSADSQPPRRNSNRYRRSDMRSED